ncbi:GntR family transcriptional regulator [Rhizobium sp. BK376]|uniref:GntR family transcriptional regulator n=1 Tax=Rhizobium sp. BK376 TaxID=2512149 RepID=UPI00104F5A1E|nr:GntR family transcriptional regulator [Rhizobium sp. BK376]TCR79560.1 GntR family transcriptional regulator [Rhizobium sp. BK376]
MTLYSFDMSWNDAKLDEGPIPLWSQIAERLRGDIDSGRFKPGDTLPGETEINLHFGVSRSTSRAALDYLETEGLIKRRSGRGSIVVEPRVERPLNRISSFSEDMRSRGLQPGYRTRWIKIVPASQVVAAELQMLPGEPVVEIDRTMFADDRPLATSITYMKPSIFEKSGIPTVEELDASSLYDRLRRDGIVIDTGDERIEGALADATTARILEVKQPAVVLICHRTSRMPDRRPVEYVVLHYLAERYSFHVKLG